MLIKQHVRILEKHMKSLFPSITIYLYAMDHSLVKDVSLFTLQGYDQIIAEMKDLHDELDERFIFCFSQLIPTVKWKFD